MNIKGPERSMDELTRKVIEEYWLKTLSGRLEPCRLPIFESARADVPGRAAYRLEFSDAESSRLKAVSKNSDAALFAVFLTGVSIVLSRYTGLDDLIIATYRLTSSVRGGCSCATEPLRTCGLSNYCNRPRET